MEEVGVAFSRFDQITAASLAAVANMPTVLHNVRIEASYLD